MKKHTVLIVDDHPLIADTYQIALNKLKSENDNIDFQVDIAVDSDSAVDKINCYTKKGKLDIVILDLNLPESKDGKILSGEDIGKLIREQHPKAQIIVSTTHNDSFLMNTIFKSINPDGFLIKNDINLAELVKAINSILGDIPYYSKSVLRFVRSQVASEDKLDKQDRIILHEISNGAKMKELPDIVGLSIASIEKRKRRLKDIFGVLGDSDRELIQIAKEKGFI
ncbi:MAG: response regulator transcription factor [Bacteroidota bacterium]